MNLQDLPALSEPLEGGLFAGLTTEKAGQHFAVVLLPDRSAKRLTWKAATAWADKAGGVLPTRPVSALLYANAKAHVEAGWYWTSEEHEADGSSAWYQYFGYGGQYYDHKSYEGRAVAVRLIHLTP